MSAPTRSTSHAAESMRCPAWLGAVVVTAALVLAGGACTSSGPSSTSARQQVVHLLEESGFPDATAKCATQRMYAALSKAELARLVSQASQGADAVDGALRGKVTDAVRSCVTADGDRGASTASGGAGATDGS